MSTIGSRVLALFALLAIATTVTVALRFAPPSRAIEDNVVGSPDTAGTVGTHASLVLDDAGLPVVSYRDETNADLKLLRCDDPACIGGGESIALPDSEGDVGASTSLALDDEGRPVVSYQDLTNGTLKILHCGNQECTEGNTIVEVDTVGPGVGATSLALDTAGNPVVSYHDLTNDDLKLVHCGDAECGEGNSIVAVDTGNFTGSYSSLALDAAGRPVISYRDGEADDLRLVRCGEANCASGNTIASPATEGNVGVYTSLELDSDGFPVVSYHDGAFGPLNLLHCGSVDCTDGNTITTPGARGLYTSLALDEEGKPVIAYYRQRDATLVIVRCGDAACSIGNRTIPLEPMGVTSVLGNHLSLALASGGLPVIAYFDAEEGDLKILRCGDADCSGKPPTPTPTAAPLVGDASCDGTVTSVDAAIVLQMDAGLVAPALCQQGADVNGDALVNSVDASLILQYVAGLLTSLPP